jgi:parallel beta-helix repeat protein
MKNQTLILLFALLLLACSAVQAIEIAGTIASTLVIMEDSWLTGNVTCKVENAPCIRVDASNVRLYLNGYTITGQRGGNLAGCLTQAQGGNNEHGIHVAPGTRRVEVLGPGMVQEMRGWGVVLDAAVTRSTIRDVTASSNCQSGIQLLGGAQLQEFTNDNDIEWNVLVRNANLELPCGGICLSSANFNRVRRNVTSGNGFTAAANPNFGIGLIGGSRGNIIEGNVATGNTHGIRLGATALMNLIFRNIVSGNPPIQIPVSAPNFQGFDILNLAPDSAANNFYDNLCSTYSGAGSPPCPRVMVPFDR